MKDGNFPIFFSCYVILVMNKTGEDNPIDEKMGDIYLESPLNEEMTVLTEDGGSLLLSEWGYERENMEFSLSGEVYKLELVKAFRDQWKETSGEYTPEGDMPPLYQANKKNPKSINDINFKNWLWREYHIKLEDIILLESQLNENLALALRHQNKIGITHTSDGIRITEENKCDPVIQKQIYEDWKKNSGQYDPKNNVIPEWEMDALHPRTVNDMKFEQYLLREYGMTRKEEIEKTFGGNVDALLKMSTIFDVFTLGTAAVAKLTGKKVWKEVGEKAVKTVAGETSEILEKKLVEGYPLYRHKANSGSFSKLKEPMTSEHVKMICENGGIGYEGIKIKIVDDPELVGSGFFGYTHPDGKVVELYPDAFVNRETLVKTLGHERIHVMQNRLYGTPEDSAICGLFEEAATRSEIDWWNYYKSINGGS